MMFISMYNTRRL